MAMLRTLRNIPPVLLSPPTKEDETFLPHFGAGHSCQNTICLSSPSQQRPSAFNLPPWWHVVPPCDTPSRHIAKLR
ncbi:hypothetical protein CLIM01_13829 [Colletotrichum limetticola]|uniref:Uncharacterized protein n=1 Tax=Colletotrichum limetticola TaxID=1209924 RepID=A0ABQ9P9L2_9PEZI|nr:hypothetical protein CLIM01_13829 [Colletotrichum limetticola]